MCVFMYACMYVCMYVSYLSVVWRMPDCDGPLDIFFCCVFPKAKGSFPPFPSLVSCYFGRSIGTPAPSETTKRSAERAGGVLATGCPPGGSTVAIQQDVHTYILTHYASYFTYLVCRLDYLTGQVVGW